MRSVWETLEHAFGIEIPHRRPAHHVGAKGTKNGEVRSSIDLLHETVLLRSRANAVPFRQWPVELLHEKFTGERKDDYVEGDEGEIQGAFAVVGGAVDEGEIEWWVKFGDILVSMVG